MRWLPRTRCELYMFGRRCHLQNPASYPRRLSDHHLAITPIMCCLLRATEVTLTSAPARLYHWCMFTV